MGVSSCAQNFAQKAKKLNQHGKAMHAMEGNYLFIIESTVQHMSVLSYENKKKHYEKQLKLWSQILVFFFYFGHRSLLHCSVIRNNEHVYSVQRNFLIFKFRIFPCMIKNRITNTQYFLYNMLIYSVVNSAVLFVKHYLNNARQHFRSNLAIPTETVNRH